MPRNSSMWVDIRIHLVVVVGLLLVIMIYNKYIAFIGLVLLISSFCLLGGSDVMIVSRS